MPKKFIKAKSLPNAAGPGFRTPDNFRAKTFGPKGTPRMKFNPAQFRTQHKGG